MCGIAAIFAYHPDASGVDESELTAIRDHMTARGPDAAGFWLDAKRRIGLGHRRLAIIDLSAAGQQPMHLAAAGLSIVFNGEIYNYRELRAGLEASGCEFRSHSDTEVLLHLYRRDGADMVKQLRGMYAFAIWDAPRAGLFVARDPYGIKPFYLADDGKTLRVASQVRALLAGGKIGRTPEPAGHVGFFLWGHIPEPFTLFKEIRALPAGTSLWLTASGERHQKEFCSIPQLFRVAMHSGAGDAPLSKQDLATALRDSVAHHLIADVPVGVFLSSGLDSTTLAALAAEQGTELRTVTLGFEEYRGTANDEVPLAEAVARQYHARHETVWVKRQDFLEQRDALFAAMDQPSIDGVNTFFVSRAARQAGLKVVLSGLGGDELFGGYPSFTQVPRIVSLCGMFRYPGMQQIGRGVRALSAGLVRCCTSPKYAGLLEYGGDYGGAYLLRRGLFMPWELSEVLDADLVRLGWDELQTISRLQATVTDLPNERTRVSALETCWYMRNQLLRDSDWASMAHSLELRVPLVDAALLRSLLPALRSDAPPTKLEIALAPNSPLPASVLNRPKTGFQIPVRDWLLESERASSGKTPARGLRGWAQYVHSCFPTSASVRNSRKRSVRPTRAGTRTTGQIGEKEEADLHVLALVTDAYGGHGGIAKFNRDLLGSLCSLASVAKVVALPRIIPEPIGSLPQKLIYVTDAAKNKFSYGWTLLKQLRRATTPNLIVCGHINLLPLAFFARRVVTRRNHKFGSRENCPVLLVIHGIDAWQPTGRRGTDRLISQVDRVVAVSSVTAQRFCDWSGYKNEKVSILPNSFNPGQFTPGPKNPELIARYGLKGKTVLMTLGRLASLERYKGFDEVLEVLPTLLLERPDLVYLIVGDGNDRSRLEAKARALGLQDKVVFAGKILESEKVDHYRLADVYVMPSRGEGFGIVYLEAMACGIPVIGSKVDGSREALRNGELGLLIDPGNPEEIKAAIHTSLQKQRGTVVSGLDYFSYGNFQQRSHELLQKFGC